MPVTPMPAANRQAIGAAPWGFRASSSTARSSPGSSPSSSCWRAASPPSACRSRNIPPSPRPRWWSAPSIPAPTPQTLQNSVTQVIEQQLTGLDNLLYFSSASNADGSVSITATFAAGHQSRHRPGAGAEQGAAGDAAAARPGAAAGRHGRQVAAQLHPDRGRLYDDTGRYNNVDISDFITSQDAGSAQPRHRRRQCPGVRRAICHAHLARSLQAAQFRPDAVRCLATPSRPRTPRSPPARSAPSPPSPGQELNATVTAQSQLQTPEQFRDIILKTDPSRRGGASGRRGAGRTGRRLLCHRRACSTACRPPASPSCWRRAPMP